MDFTRKLSFLVFLLCVLISLKNQNAETNRKDYSTTESRTLPTYTDLELQDHEIHDNGRYEWLRYDYYNESCPFADHIIRSSLRQIHQSQPDVAPALLRIFFHDCFVEGCDASVLLDAADGSASEKDSPPNESLKGFDLIDTIKSELEEACPGVVSCADIIALAARESVILAGGPFYPLYTGRRDSTVSFPEVATYELPSPQDDLSKTIEAFASRGFDERETVSLLGAHSTGTIHCKFFLNRLYNFSGSDKPDPSIDTEFLDLLRSKCSNGSHPSSAQSSSYSLLSGGSFQDQGIKMDYEGPGTGFGTLYYRSLLQGKGLLYVDQQLTAGEETEAWVRAYASDITLFQRDFGLTMIKLSNYRTLSATMGQIRLNCRKVN